MRRALVLASLALLLVPLGHAQTVGMNQPDSAAVTLHMHLVTGMDFPINTQPAQFGYTETFSTGLATATLTCVPAPAPGGLAQESHVYRGYSSPSYVEYGVIQEGRVRVWPERQMGYAAMLDSGVPPILHWYMETQAGATLPGAAPQPPVVVPNVVVQATLRQSSQAVSIMDKSYDVGPVIAEGRSAPAVLAADASQGVEHSMVGGHHVYGFTVPMPITEAALGTMGFTLRIDVFLDNPACSDPGGAGSVMPNLVRPYADAEHRPRITAGVLDPVRVTRLDPQFVAGDVVVHGRAQSVWGNYDVDEGNLSLQVDGPAGHQVLQPANVTQVYWAHGHHDAPVDIAWVFNRTHAPPGLYWFNFTAANDQHTAFATATAAVHLGPDVAYNATAVPTAVVAPSRAAPGLPPAFLAVVLVAAAGVAVRRRARP